MTTHRAIKEAFMRLYSRIEYSKISVSAFCAEVPIARTTFYDHFRNIDDVKREIEVELVDGLEDATKSVSHGNLSTMNFTKFLDTIEIFIESMWEWFRIFTIEQLNLRFIDMWKNAIKSNFSKRYPDKKSYINYELVSEIVGSATIAGFIYWIENPDLVDTENMKSLIESALESCMSVI